MGRENAGLPSPSHSASLTSSAPDPSPPFFCQVPPLFLPYQWREGPSPRATDCLHYFFAARSEVGGSYLGPPEQAGNKKQGPLILSFPREDGAHAGHPPVTSSLPPT